jgi:hypothetical protein
MRSYLFRIVHVFWTDRGCVDELVSMFCSDPRWGFDTTFLLFSGYTLSLPGRVSGEQRGGAAKILSRISMETNLIYASTGEIRTYPHLLDSRHAVQMQLMVILLCYVYMLEDG